MLLEILILFISETHESASVAGDPVVSDEDLQPFDEPLYQNQEADPKYSHYLLDVMFGLED